MISVPRLKRCTTNAERVRDVIRSIRDWSWPNKSIRRAKTWWITSSGMSSWTPDCSWKTSSSFIARGEETDASICTTLSTTFQPTCPSTWFGAFECRLKRSFRMFGACGMKTSSKVRVSGKDKATKAFSKTTSSSNTADLLKTASKILSQSKLVFPN